MDSVEARNILSMADYCLKHRLQMTWQAQVIGPTCPICEMENKNAELEKIEAAKKVLGWLC